MFFFVTENQWCSRLNSEVADYFAVISALIFIDFTSHGVNDYEKPKRQDLSRDTTTRDSYWHVVSFGSFRRPWNRENRFSKWVLCLWSVPSGWQPSETKLLRTGTKYVLGRKERQLVVNHKKISHDHAQFMVGPYSSDDVVRSDLRLFSVVLLLLPSLD